MIKSRDSFFETSDKAKIYYEDYGEGEPIILVPGFLCTSKFFRKNIEGLSKNKRLILVDSRGHGSSSKILEGQNIPRYAQDIKELIDILNLENVTLIGWSLGGSIVLSFWRQYNNYRLKSLGIVDSALYPFSPEEWNDHPLKGFDMDGMNDVMASAIADYEEYCHNFASSVWKNEPSKKDVEWVKNEMMKTPPWITFALYSDFLHRNFVIELPEIDIPLILFSANSKVIPNGIKMARSYKKYINTYYEFHSFENSGHMMFYTEPEKFNNKLLSFLEKIED